MPLSETAARFTVWRPVMNAKNNPVCLILFLLLPHLCVGVPRQHDESKPGRISVKGRIVGYSMRSRLRSAQGQVLSPPHDEFLFMVEQGDESLGAVKYIKIRYKVTPEHHEDLPLALFEESSRRPVTLERDETCDESMESFVYGNKFGNKRERAEARKRFPNLVRPRGAEDISLPEEGTLRCYSFEWDWIEK
jgi:hypothetical protein